MNHNLSDCIKNGAKMLHVLGLAVVLLSVVNCRTRAKSALESSGPTGVIPIDCVLKGVDSNQCSATIFRGLPAPQPNVCMESNSFSCGDMTAGYEVLRTRFLEQCSPFGESKLKGRLPDCLPL
jgi:hypothetical protein